MTTGDSDSRDCTTAVVPSGTVQVQCMNTSVQADLQVHVLGVSREP
jgi:hypothetical protein